MKTPNFSTGQYIDAPTLNAASALVSGDLALGAGLFKPGLVFPEAAGYGATGLSVNASLPSPFAVLFGTGAMAQAHGVTTGADSQSYSVSFSGAVPGSGSTTAYLAASYLSIQQSPLQIVGPPVGHPDYNPNFAPYTAYTQNVDSLSVFVTTTKPDNSAIFELFRVTLAAAATGVGTMNTAYQQRASGPNVTQTLAVSGTYQVLVANAGRRHQATAASTLTLPSVAGSDGLTFPFSSATSGVVTIQAAGSDLIYGGPNAASGIASFAIAQGTAVTLEGDQGIWQIVSAGQPGNLRLAHGECYLSLSGGNLLLTPYNGNNLIVNGVQCAIPAAGLSLAPTSLTSGTAYYIYATSTTPGVVTGLEASTTGHSTDTTLGNVGVEIKTGDSSRTLVGLVNVIAGPAFADSGQNRLVASWFNPVSKTGVGTFSTTRSTTATTLGEVNSEIRVNFVTFVNREVEFRISGEMGNLTTTQLVVTALNIDGITQNESAASNVISAGSGAPIGISAKKSVSEGTHFCSLNGAVTGGTGTWAAPPPSNTQAPTTLEATIQG